MMDFLKEIVKLEWLRKVSAKEVFLLALFLAVASGVVRIIPDDLLKAWGDTSLIGQLRPYFGIAGLLSAILFLTILLAELQKVFQRYKFRKHIQNRLRALTNHEKRILKPYIDHQTRTLNLPDYDGMVNELEADQIISRVPTASRNFRIYGKYRWPYNIEIWAWEYLNKHPALLSLASDPLVQNNEQQNNADVSGEGE